MKKRKTLFLTVLLLFLGFGCCTPAILKTGALPNPEKDRLVRQWMPAGWHEAYESLTRSEKVETDQWLSWFAGKRDGDKQKILSRPYGFGVCGKSGLNRQKEALGPSVEALIDRNNPDPEGWWNWYASLPEKDYRISREFVRDWVRSFSRLPEEQQALSNLRLDQWHPEASLPSDQLEEKLNSVDENVLTVVEEHVVSAASWWSGYFARAEKDEETARQEMEWLLWFSKLSPEDREMVDRKTFLFFASEKPPGQAAFSSQPAP